MLNWTAFEQLSDSVHYNFEILCRTLIRRQYGRYGYFAARANQPGVEFHLKLHASCDLGDANEWFGWQCRWYDLPSGKNLGTGRCRKIEEAIRITEKELPDLTDWVLWTRRPLTKDDQKWFYGLQTHMRLHLWSAADVEGHLTGGAAILRGTYFGELILTPDNLSTLHNVAVAPIRKRWLPEVHQSVDAERVVRRMLGESGTWDDLLRLSEQLLAYIGAIEGNIIGNITRSLADATTEIASHGRTFAATLAGAHDCLVRGDIDLLQQLLTNRPAMPTPELAKLPRQLRSCRNCAALAVTNILADIRSAHSLFDEVEKYLTKRIFAVVADAGCGKTQLAAQLTAQNNHRAAGILIHGRDLHAGQSLNDLANRITIPGMPTPVSSMEALIAAVDAAGQRAHQRIPIVIDALNEAEDPRNWQDLLASLHEQLRQYPYVLVICTLRTAFTDEALPSDIDQIEIPNFGDDIYEAIRRYFHYYRINPADSELPIDLLSHPLTLRLFCEVTNPTRQQDVGTAPMSWSLTSIFERYLKHSAESISELSPRTRRYYEQDVRNALYLIGRALWEQHTRSLDERDLRQILGDDTRPWDQSIIRALEQESVILRIPGDPGTTRVTPIYDAIAGHLIADAILSRLGSSGIEQWLADPATVTALAGKAHECHPLAMDIFRELVGLVPRRFHRLQLWQLLNEPLRTKALYESANLEGSYIDTQTVEELAKIIVEPTDMLPDLFNQLWHTRGAPNHPLNTEFLDTVLRPMAIPNRDLRWTEWLRRNSDNLLSDLQYLEKLWRERTSRSGSDRLRARWVMWMLTSTVRILRDQATRTLYWFGLGDPSALYELAVEALTINDPYIPERMLAAAYGTTMALQVIQANQDFKDKILPNFASKLYQDMFANKAPHSTTHALMRDYARQTIQISLLHKPDLLNPNQRKRIIPPFREGGIRRWGQQKGFEPNRKFYPGEPLGIDFANYTLGGLLPNRSNYDLKNKEYQKIFKNIYWRLSQLGYSPSVFKGIDKSISLSQGYSRSTENANRVDRYGKKYSWIAFYELYGLRQDKEILKTGVSKLDKRPSDIDIDPSFPGEQRNIQVINEDWLGNRNKSLLSWIAHSKQPNIIPYLMLDELDNIKGPWIFLSGFINQIDKEHHRSIFTFLRGLFVPEQYHQDLLQHLENQLLDVNNFPVIPRDYYTFAGEIPWCETFPENGFTNYNIVIGHQVKKLPHNENRFYRKGKRLSEEDTKDLLQNFDIDISDVNHNALNKLFHDEKVTIREITTYYKRKFPIHKIIPVLVPVRENNWESYHSGVNPGRAALVPTREIAETSKLSLKLPSWDMYDAAGNIASISIKWGDSWGTGHNLCYLRKDILDQFLNKKSLNLVLTLWGARETSLDYKDLSQVNTLKYTRKEFKKIYYYQNGRLIAGRSKNV